MEKGKKKEKSNEMLDDIMSEKQFDESVEITGRKKRKKHKRSQKSIGSNGESAVFDDMLPNDNQRKMQEEENSPHSSKKKKKKTDVRDDDITQEEHFSEKTVHKNHKKHSKERIGNNDESTNSDEVLTNNKKRKIEEEEPHSPKRKKNKKRLDKIPDDEVTPEDHFDESADKIGHKKHKKRVRIRNNDGSINSDEILTNNEKRKTQEEEPPQSLKKRKKKKKKRNQDIHKEAEVNEDGINSPDDDPAIARRRSRQGHASFNDYFTGSARLSVDLFLEGGFEHFPSAQLHDFGMAKLTKEQTSQLRLKGMPIQNGRWMKWEDEIVKTNMMNFCKEVDIFDTEKLVFPRLCEEETEFLEQLIKEKQMYHKIGYGIHRPLKNIYFRCRYLFDTNNYKGHFSEEEVRKILRLQKKYGNKWTKIGRIVERSGHSIGTKIRFGQADRTLGAWSEEEKNKLVAAVREVVSGEVGSEAWYYKIPWERVSKKVKTREARQCRQEWLTFLSCLTPGTTGPEVERWNKSDDVKLIERIYEMNIHDEEDIDWLALLPEFEKAVSPQKLQYRWYMIKNSYVPRHRYKTLDEILDYLGDEVLSILKKQAKKEKKERKKKKKKQKMRIPKSVEIINSSEDSE